MSSNEYHILLIHRDEKTEKKYCNIISKIYKGIIHINVISESKITGRNKRNFKKSKDNKFIFDGLQYDHVFFIMDLERDPYTGNSQECGQSKTIHDEFNAYKKEGYKLAHSLPCLEYWFILHKQKNSNANLTAHDALLLCQELYPRYKKSNFGVLEDILLNNHKIAMNNFNSIKNARDTYTYGGNTYYKPDTGICDMFEILECIKEEVE